MQWNAFSQKTGENKYFPNEGLVFEKLFSCMKKYLIVNVKFYQGDSDVFRRWGLADFKLLFIYLKDFLKMVLSSFFKSKPTAFSVSSGFYCSYKLLGLIAVLLCFLRALEVI